MKLFSLNRDPNWHRWFAWRPVWAESTSRYGFPCKELVGLEFVERKAIDGAFWGYKYAKIGAINERKFLSH